ncbi:unnamed protein product [Linum tenue]|uniref:Uncharacterized protein n=1 Tax=Linum tenue TaxID=586396 RepID=A0AAV0P9I7_9ROSI|nr:unnamed protein product [Linum tenue]
MVRLFDFKSDKHFVASSDRTNLKVYQLSHPITSPSSIRKTHWREIVSIISSRDDGSDDDDEHCYDGLLFFDGHGKIEGREALTKLAQHLTRLHLMVSPGGYCFQDAAELGEYKDFGVHYLRLNDQFDWSRHGVNLVTTTVWPRLKLKYVVPKQGNPSRPATVEGGVSKEKYDELKTLVKEKDKELEKLRELQNLREEMEKASEAKNEELRKLRKEKDEELRKLIKKKDGELQVLKKLSMNQEEWQIHSRQRRPVPPETFRCEGIDTYSGYRYFYVPKMRDGQLNPFCEIALLVNEEMTARSLLPPLVHVETRIVGQFDVNNWWFTKALHREGGVTMLAYYDGHRDHVRVNTPMTERPIRLPYSKNEDVYADRRFFFVSMGNEIRLAFAYRV